MQNQAATFRAHWTVSNLAPVFRNRRNLTPFQETLYVEVNKFLPNAKWIFACRTKSIISLILDP